MNFFSKNIKFLREQRQLTHQRLGMMCGLSADSLKNIENGTREPALDDLVNITEALNYPLDRMIMENLEKNHYLLKSFDFKFLALDIDGVLTDGGMYYTENGDEIKKFSTKDGLAIKRLTNKGMNVGFISSGVNAKTIENRAQTLGVQKVFIGTWAKKDVLSQWCEELGIGFENVAYIGDDVNDLEVIGKCGLTACPADAVIAVKEAVHFVLSRKGGDNCVREFVEKYIEEIR